MSDVLVTGGAGFIGSHVVDELVRMGRRVIVLDDLSGGFADNVPEAATFVRGSILNNRLVTSLFETYQIETVFHLAAYAAEGLSHFIKRYNYRNNLLGSVHLINAAVNSGVTCFVFTSSIAVYGDAPCPMSEDMPPQPVDSYGIAKAAVEAELRVTQRLFGLRFIVFRPHNVYGERQNIGDRYRNVVGIFMNQIMKGDPLTIFGDGGQTRAFTHVSDVAPTIARAALTEAAHNQVFNLGADEPVSVRRLAEEVSRAMGVAPRVRHVAPRDEVREAYCTHEKAARVLGFKARMPLSEGLARMARWARRHGSRRSKRFRHIEITRNLPAVWQE